MEPSADDIVTLTDEIWVSVLGMPLIPVWNPEEGDAPTGASSITASVHIQGGWEGTVTVCCPSTLATKVTAVMFGMEPDEVSTEEVNDALGEIANMVGGGVKGLMPGPSVLSLPTVIGGIDYTVVVPGATVVQEVRFRCQDEPVTVGVLCRPTTVVP